MSDVINLASGGNPFDHTIYPGDGKYNVLEYYNGKIGIFVYERKGRQVVFIGEKKTTKND